MIRFAGGGALYTSQPDSKLFVERCSFTFNNASNDGQGGALLVSFGAIFLGSNLSISHNYAKKGGGVLIDVGKAYISNSTIFNNSASVSGGGMFCSNKPASGIEAAGAETSTIDLKNVSIIENSIIDPLKLGVGADLFIIGSVVFSADNVTYVSMKGQSDRDVTPAIISVVTDSSKIFLKLECRS
jgi:hypothetical protein